MYHNITTGTSARSPCNKVIKNDQLFRFCGFVSIMSYPLIENETVLKYMSKHIDVGTCTGAVSH